MTEPRTKREIVEAEDGLRYHHPLSEWLRHGDRCPARRLSMDTRSLDGPCDCGLTATLAAGVHLGDEGLDELRALSEAATPGPWERVTEGNYDQRHAAAAAFLSIMAARSEDNSDIEFSDVTYIRAGWPNVAMVGNGPKQTENGDFIVAAVNYVRAALAPSLPRAGEGETP